MLKIKNYSRSFGRFIFFFFFLLFSNLLRAQDIVVTYENFISLNHQLERNPSLKIINNGDTVSNNFSFPEGLELTTFLSRFEVKGNPSTATIFRAKETSNSWKNSEDVPDSTKLAFGRWFSYKNGIETELWPEKMELESTGDFKTILGFKCQKFIGKSKVDPAILDEIWVTSELPRTLVPNYSISTEYGAVLEGKFNRSGISFKATNIKML